MDDYTHAQRTPHGTGTRESDSTVESPTRKMRSDRTEAPALKIVGTLRTYKSVACSNCDSFTHLTHARSAWPDNRGDRRCRGG